MPVTDFNFRRTMGSFATGVTVVTTLTPQATYHGITVSSFVSVSLDPPLVSICIDKKTEAHDLIITAGVFCANILNEHQQYLSDRFAGRDPTNREPFADLKLKTAVTGAPVFAEGLGFADCRIINAVDAGDHTIFVGQVLELAFLEYHGEPDKHNQPLIYFRSDYHHLQR